MTTTENGQRDELALGVVNVYYEASDDSGSRHWEEMANILAAAGYRKPRTITTVEELDALPVESVLRSHAGVVWEKGEFPDEPGLPFWTTTGTNHEYPARHIPLPATVLWEPEAEATR